MQNTATEPPADHGMPSVSKVQHQQDFILVDPKLKQPLVDISGSVDTQIAVAPHLINISDLSTSTAAHVVISPVIEVVPSAGTVSQMESHTAPELQ